MKDEEYRKYRNETSINTATTLSKMIVEDHPDMENEDVVAMMIQIFAQATIGTMVSVAHNDPTFPKCEENSDKLVKLGVRMYDKVMDVVKETMDGVDEIYEKGEK